jgi:enamine deaminase RidA (YjgF/YER057c/UK114 family)
MGERFPAADYAQQGASSGGLPPFQTSATIQEQTHQCLKNISAVLLAAGSSLDKIVSATVILVDEDDFAGMNEEWVKWSCQARPRVKPPSCR